ncbi:hypothetical protein Q7P37_010096 [Cladosporium fusiforme]
MYIVDDAPRGPEADNAQVVGDAHATQHKKVCDLIFNTFSNEFVSCDVKSVRMQRGQTERHLTQYFEQEFAQYNANHLVGIFFHGQAGGRNENYTWILRGPGPNRMNAFNLIKLANKSQADIMFLLDCPMPDRHFVTHKLRRKDHMTEMIVAGDSLRDTDGRIEYGDHGFTESLCRVISSMAAHPTGPPQSFLHALRDDTTMASQPKRLWFNKTRRKPAKGHKIRIWRFVLYPEKVAGDGGLEMYSCELQSPNMKDDSFEKIGDGDDDDASDDGRDVQPGNGRSDDLVVDSSDDEGYDEGRGGGGGGDGGNGGGGYGGGNGNGGGNGDPGDTSDSDSDSDSGNPLKMRTAKQLRAIFFGSRKKIKRSLSPADNFMKDEDDEDHPIKQERESSVSSDVEFLHARPLRYAIGSRQRMIDLTGARQSIDPTVDGDPESLFMPLT